MHRTKNLGKFAKNISSKYVGDLTSTEFPRLGRVHTLSSPSLLLESNGPIKFYSLNKRILQATTNYSQGVGRGEVYLAPSPLYFGAKNVFQSNIQSFFFIRRTWYCNYYWVAGRREENSVPQMRVHCLPPPFDYSSPKNNRFFFSSSLILGFIHIRPK